jgi:hypothetical protein
VVNVRSRAWNVTVVQNPNVFDPQQCFGYRSLAVGTARPCLSGQRFSSGRSQEATNATPESVLDPHSPRRYPSLVFERGGFSRSAVMIPMRHRDRLRVKGSRAN